MDLFADRSRMLDVTDPAKGRPPPRG